MNKTLIPENPFVRIALSCSGGGYRAASYHLGAMAYLNRVHYNGAPLLNHVKMLSTVSGGTITGIVYALGKARGDDFNTIYEFLVSQLKQIDLVKEGISLLNPDAAWPNPYKTKNLINAFALQYDRFLTKGATVGQLDLKNTHLESVVFNSTEFTKALDFRFRNPGTGYSGNYYNIVRTSDMAEAKLSDVMAASSCFPGGFEPIIWPDDFVHSQSPKIKELVQPDKKLGLMDGGIYDNQGIDSILRYKRKRNEANFDLIIVSDVSSPKMTAYAPVIKAKKTGFYRWTLKDFLTQARRINQIVTWVLIVIVLIGLAVPAYSGYKDTTVNGFLVGLALAAALLIAIKNVATARLLSAYQWVQYRIQKIIPEFYREKLSHLQIENLSLHRIEPLLYNRLKSVSTLMTSVFLKVVRRLNYNILFEDQRYDFRRIGNLIRQLTEDDYVEARIRERAQKKIHRDVLANSIFTGDYQKDIWPKLQALTEETANFGTTLWFTDPDKVGGLLDKLILTGQITMCYNLIRYLEELIYTPNNGFSGLSAETQLNLKQTYEHCKADWNSFKKEI